VTAVAWTARTQGLLRRSRRAGGRTVDSIPQGYAIPLDALVVQPQAYADVLPQTGREIRRLRRNTALLSRTSARLRRLGVGDRLSLAGGLDLRVAGIVDDELVGFAELVLTGRDAGGGNDATRQLLVATTQPERVERRLAGNDAVRIRTLSPTLRTAPRLVARPLETKARFGEFAVGLPYGSDWIRIEPRWLDRNIVTRSVPILGAVTCNRRLFAPLRHALRRLERRGLSSVVDRADYAGCFAPRRIPGSGSLSLHAWGLAIDINAAANPRLGNSRQDRRLVRAMEGAGFTWGGRWPTVPDPMHFELHP
jgi:D-alanyl-D-alanine carboxypeptidase